MTLPSWAWAAVAAFAGVGMEVLYKKTSLQLFDPRMLVAMAVAQMIIGTGIYHLVKSNDNLIVATILFSSSTLTIRVALTLLWGDHVSRGTWVGLVLMIAARLAHAVL